MITVMHLPATATVINIVAFTAALSVAPKGLWSPVTRPSARGRDHLDRGDRPGRDVDRLHRADRRCSPP
jgi:hypothetical protein